MSELLEIAEQALAEGDEATAMEAMDMYEAQKKAPPPVPAQAQPQVMSAAPQIQAADAGFMGNIREQQAKRMGNILQSIGQVQLGRRSIPEAGLNIIAETIKSGYDALSEIASAIVPDQVKDFLGEWAEQELGANLNTPQGRLVMDAVEQYRGFAEENPRTAENLENTLVVGSSLIPFAKAPKTVPVKESWLDLVRPKRTETVAKSMARRAQVKQGIAGKTVTFKPSTSEKKIIKVLQEVPGVKPGNLIHENIENIMKAIGKESKSLRKKMKDANIQIKRTEVSNRIADNLKAMVDKSPIYAKFEGKIPKQVKDVFLTAQRVIQSEKNNLTGLLNARQNLDELYQSALKQVEKTGKWVETPESRAFKEARDSINDLIHEKAMTKGIDYNASKERVSLMYKGLNALESKAGKETLSAFKRQRERIGKLLPDVVTGRTTINRR